MLKKMDSPKTELAAAELGVQIFISDLLFPAMGRSGLPCVEYWRGVLYSDDAHLETFEVSPLYMLSERKELRKWWRLNDFYLKPSVHREMLRVARSCTRQATEAVDNFREKLAWCELDSLESVPFWRCFPNLEGLRLEARTGLHTLVKARETGELIVKAHVAMLSLEDWWY